MNERIEAYDGANQEGQWVYDSQGVASDEGFGHVSKHWYPQTISYDEGMQKLEAEQGHRQDYLVPVAELGFGIEDIKGKPRFVVSVDDQDFVPNNHALSQMTAKLCEGKGTGFTRWLTEDQVNAKDEARYNRDQQDAETIQAIIENGFRRILEDKPDTKYKVRTYDDGTMRAFLSEKYAEVDNRWYLEQIEDIIPNGRLSHWRGNADTIYGNVLIPDTIREEEDSDYGGMVSIGNCEIGKRNVLSMPSLFRAICMNGCIWGQTKGSEIRVRHIGDIDLDQLSKKIRNNIEVQIPLLPAGIERLLGVRLMENEGNTMKSVIAAVSDIEKLQKRDATAVLEAWVMFESKTPGENRNLFGVVNSVTRAGQFLGNDNWVKFDQLGGRLVNYTDNQWDRVCNRAAEYEDDDFARIFSSKAVLAA